MCQTAIEQTDTRNDQVYEETADNEVNIASIWVSDDEPWSGMTCAYLNSTPAYCALTLTSRGLPPEGSDALYTGCCGRDVSTLFKAGAVIVYILLRTL